MKSESKAKDGELWLVKLSDTENAVVTISHDQFFHGELYKAPSCVDLHEDMLIERLYTQSEIDRKDSAEWKNGDECLYMNSNTTHVVIGRDDKYVDFFWCKSSCGNVNLLNGSCLSKLEAQE